MTAAHIDLAANKEAAGRAKETQKEVAKRAKQADKDKDARDKAGHEETAEEAEARRVLKIEAERAAEDAKALADKAVGLEAQDKAAKKALADAGKAVA